GRDRSVLLPLLARHPRGPAGSGHHARHPLRAGRDRGRDRLSIHPRGRSPRAVPQHRRCGDGPARGIPAHARRAGGLLPRGPGRHRRGRGPPRTRRRVLGAGLDCGRGGRLGPGGSELGERLGEPGDVRLLRSGAARGPRRAGRDARAMSSAGRIVRDELGDMRSPLIEDHALLSDQRTTALVTRDGDIDWLCMPRFDSDALFCSLLGDDSHGHWSLRIADGEVLSRRYLPGTMVLETVWRSPTGTAIVTEFLPIDGGGRDDRSATTSPEGAGSAAGEPTGSTPGSSPGSATSLAGDVDDHSDLV